MHGGGGTEVSQLNNGTPDEVSGTQIALRRKDLQGKNRLRQPHLTAKDETCKLLTTQVRVSQSVKGFSKRPQVLLQKSKVGDVEGLGVFTMVGF